MNRNKVIVLCGFAASGKDTICKYIAEHYPKYKMAISHTNRPMRPNESQGNPYYFVTTEDFKEMIVNDEFIECREYHTIENGVPTVWYYGMHDSSINLDEHSYITVLDILGLREFKEQFGDKVFSVFIEVDEPTRRERAMQRGGFELAEWERRWEDDKNQFTPEVINELVDYKVENYNFEECVNNILKTLGEIK